MVSKPDADMSKQQTLQNYMLTPIYPGSVFKTVIAAAAIEQNEVKPGTSFNCNLNLYGEPGMTKARSVLEKALPKAAIIRLQVLRKN